MKENELVVMFRRSLPFSEKFSTKSHVVNIVRFLNNEIYK